MIMKRNDFLEIKNLEIKALGQKIDTAKKELAGLVMDKNMSKLKDRKSISKKRKEIAQMMTVRRQKQLLGELELKVEDKNLTSKGGKK